MKISIIGAGYVGLVTGATFAKLGNEVILVDVVKEKVETINMGKSPIYEKGLDELLKGLVENKKLRATEDLESAILSTDISFVSVGTPSKEDGSIDLSYVFSAVEQIGEVLRKKDGYHLVVIKSTVIPGTTEKAGKTIEKVSGKKEGVDFGIAMNPEFLREGVALEDSLNPDRVVLGVKSKRDEEILKELYSPLNAPVLVVDPSTAEMIKYTSNAFLASKISFANEIANICERFGIDVEDVMKGVGMDHRISPYFLKAGAGFGGSCFPKDVKALISAAEEKGYDPILLKDVIEINDRQPLRMIELAEKYAGELKGKNIALLGLSFKPDTDDIRESRAIPLVKELLKKGANVIAYDPKAMENFKRLFPEIEYAKTAEKALEKADICMIQADWEEFKEIDYDKYPLKLIVDGRRTLKKDVKIPYAVIGKGKKGENY